MAREPEPMNTGGWLEATTQSDSNIFSRWLHAIGIAVIFGLIGVAIGTVWQAHTDKVRAEAATQTDEAYAEQGAIEMIRLGVFDWNAVCAFEVGRTKGTTRYDAARACHINFHIKGEPPALTENGR